MSPLAATAALLQKAHPAAVDAGHQGLDAPVARVEREQPAVGVRHQKPSVGHQLQTQRASAREADPVDPAAVGPEPEDAAVLGARVDEPVDDEHVLRTVARDRHDRERSPPGHGTSRR
jgi:hypothetical protein